MRSVQLLPADAFGKTPDGKLAVTSPRDPRCRATQTTPIFSLLNDPKEPFAIDIEFQEYRTKVAEKWSHRMGRIAIVNTRGQAIYDTYVRYEKDERVDTKLPPRFLNLGVTWRDLSIANGAKPIQEVEANLSKIMSGRTIVGHGMRLDIGAIDGSLWEGVTKVDSQHMYGFTALRTLSVAYLGESIQQSSHDPVEDARATMLLYLLRCPYKSRDSFKDAPFVFADDDFPSLGSTAKKGGAGGRAARKEPECFESPKVAKNEWA